MILQKLAHNKQQECRRYREFCGLLLSPQWLVGFLFIVAIPLPLDIAALSMTPQSVIAPLSGATIVLSQVVAPRMLGERKPVLFEWLACLAIVLGTAFLAAMGNPCSIDYTVDEIRALYTHSPFLIQEAAAFLLIAIAVFGVVSPAPTNVFGGQVRPLCHGFLAGALAGQQNVMFKAVSENIGQTFSGNAKGWEDWLSYVMLIGVALSATLQIMNLNQGLALMEATRYLPLYNAFLIICSSMSGMTFYQEYEQLTALGGAGYALSVAIIVLGVLALARASCIEAMPKALAEALTDTDFMHSMGDRDRMLEGEVKYKQEGGE